MNEHLLDLRPYPMAELQARKAAIQARGIELVDFGVGDPIEPTPPFIPAALRAAIPAISQYPSVTGTSTLRAAAAAYLQRRFGCRLDPERAILPSAGSKEAIFHLALAFLDPASQRDTVLYGTPGYPVYQHGCLFAGGRELPVVLERATGYRLDLTRLDREALTRTRIAWFNYPHNPTGACVDAAYWREQAAVCREHGIILASDECYCDLHVHDEAPPSALAAGTAGVLAFHSCSKRSGMTGYRSGFIVGDPELIATYRRWRAAMGVASPAFIEAAATAAWSDDDHVAERRGIFTAKRAVLEAGLHERGIAVLPSHAGLYCWARVPRPHGDADAYAQELLEAGIVVSPGGFFGAGGAGWFRCALVPSLDDCRRAMQRWPD
ncbi:MAG: succinyldiaminopimelate transaminase [Planctomycetota bacterium]